MDVCLVVRDGAGQYRPATHAEILQAADRIQSDLSLEEAGDWPDREWYVATFKRHVSENDFWLFEAGLLFDGVKTATDERDQMVKIITKDWFEGLAGFRRANPPALKRLMERNGLNVRDAALYAVDVQYRSVARPSEADLDFAQKVFARMPESAVEILDCVHVLTRGTYQGSMTAIQRICRVTVTSGLIQASRDLLIQQSS